MPPSPEYLKTLTKNTQRYIRAMEAEVSRLRGEVEELSRGGVHWWHKMRKVAKVLGVEKLSDVCGAVECLCAEAAASAASEPKELTP